MAEPILLIDGSSFIFRAFYAVKNLTSPAGMPTNAIYGVVNMLKQMQKKYTTPHWVCVFDAKGKTFRDEIYSEYKANRRETPAELIVQFPYIHEIIADLGIPVIIQEGVEADDVIATIAKKYAATGHKILIATGDKDFAQIVDDNITLVNTMTNEQLDRQGIITKYGVTPEQFIDYLSLIGDTIDNVPGVHKCGPKTAQKWLNEYQSIANLIINQEQLSGVVGDNFRSAIDWLPTAQKLITIDCNVSVDNFDIHNLENLSIKPSNWQKLAAVYRELNFRNWLKEAEAQLATLPQAAEPTPTLINAVQNSSLPVMDDDLFSQPPEITPVKITALARNIVQITTLAELRTLVEQLLLITSTTAFNIFLEDYTDNSSAIAMVAIANENNLYLIQLQASNHQELLFSEDNDYAQKIALLAQYWHSPIAKICYRHKQQCQILARHDIQLTNVRGDLELASYIQNSQQNHDLAAILNRETATSLPTITEALGKGAKRRLFSSLTTSEQIAFATNMTNNLLETEQQIISSFSAGELRLYREMELPLSWLLFKLEQHGILLNISHLKRLSAEMHAQVNHLENQIFQHSGQVFNINSPKQLQDILFNRLNLPVVGITKNTSGYSTNEEALSILAEQGYPIANDLLEYRYLTKLLNTYIDRLPELTDANGFIHTTLEQTVVTSGRLSSREPNLQNIPVRSNYGQAIRECFIAAPGYKLICADYSQIELRILAHISNDKNLIAAFNSDADIHAATASQIFNKPLTEISKDERRYAKSINFGLIYGKSVFGLAKELKIDRAEAKLYIDNYFANYPQVKAYMERIKDEAHRDGFVSTIYGRKIFLPNINAGNNILRQAEERLALNAPMQGSAADIIKLAMLNVNGYLEAHQLASVMVLQVHDELIFHVPDHEVEIIQANLERLMSETTKLAVPLKVDVKAATNWGEAH